MTHYGTWNPYAGSSSIILAVVLLIATGVLTYVAIRLHQPVVVKRPGKFLGVSLVVMWLLSVILFLVADGHLRACGCAAEDSFHRADEPHCSHNNILSCDCLFRYCGHVRTERVLGRSWECHCWYHSCADDLRAPLRSHRDVANVSSRPRNIVYIALLFTANPRRNLKFCRCSRSHLIMRLSRYTLFLLAAMFLIFAVWALFGFAYPATPIPFALNMISKIIAFATAISLFLPPKKIAKPL